MMRHLLKITVVFAIAISFTGCYNAIEQTLLNGDYEQALESSLQRIRNDRHRDEYIALAEKAYHKIVSDDKYKIERLKSNNNPNRWGKIYYAYKEMERRQRTVEPYLPITYSDGRTAQFSIYNYMPVMEEARKNAADYHYQTAAEMLVLVSKEAARDAYYELKRIDQYASHYKDKEQLKRIAKEKGTNHILIDFKQAYNVTLPPNFTQSLASYNYENEVNGWSRLYRNWTDTFEYDLAIQVTVEGVDISPEQVKEIHFHEQKQVEDGYEPLTDAEGNFAVDSSGNIIKVLKYKTLHCYVTEWIQHKSAKIYSSFEIYDNRYKQKVVDHRLEDNILFDNSYAQANGHIEILTSDLKSKLNRAPLPFPTNYDMIMQTSTNLSHQVARAIDQNDNLLESL